MGRINIVKGEVFFNGKDVGHLYPEKSIYVTYRGEEHFFRKFGGYGISEQVLDALISLKIDYIVINYNNYKAYVTATINFLTEKAKEFDFQGDKQFVLPMEHWELQMMGTV